MEHEGRRAAYAKPRRGKHRRLSHRREGPSVERHQFTKEFDIPVIGVTGTITTM